MTHVIDTTHSPAARLTPVPVADVRLDDRFWKPRLDALCRHGLMAQWQQCERTGRIDNFRTAAGLAQTPYRHLAADTDLYKWAEGAALAMLHERNDAVAAKLDELVDLIAAAQDDDGYLMTQFVGPLRDKRWTDLASAHELYCGGHLIQAAVAHHRATGDRRLLDVAVRWADHVDARFGPGREPAAPGHPEVEMALVELARQTGDSRYLDLSLHLIEQRGSGGNPQHQDHLPIREQHAPTGHAVRQLYLLCGVADVVMQRPDAGLSGALEAQWQSLVNRRMSITGGVGARYDGEAFGEDYELPNRTCYNETCAAISNAMWQYRMLHSAAEARFADVMERALYNGVLSGVALDVDACFYTNPLEHDGGPDLSRHARGANRRTHIHWDRTACCPPNIARTLAALPGYVASTDRDGGVWVHLYVQSTARIGDVTITQSTDYPWDGKVTLTVAARAPKRMTLHLRVPGWAAGATLDGERVEAGTYVAVNRTWHDGDSVTLELPMPVTRTHPHPRNTSCNHCVALSRGPLVYCVESADHGDAPFYGLQLPDDAQLQATHEPATLGGVTVITGEAAAVKNGDTRPVALRAVPYHAWANREPGAMRVWLPRLGR